MAINSPKEILVLVEKSAASKLDLRAPQLFISAFLAGAYIAMGGLFSIIIGFGFPDASASAPGLQRLLSGLVFPFGILLVVFAGAELFTGNNAVLVPGALNRRYGWRKVAENWIMVFVGNFVGSLFFAYVLVYLPDILTAEAWRTAAVAIAETKTNLSWMTVFLRGIGANWLVCLAVWLSLSTNDTTGKIVGLFLPVMCFVVIGYEHCIANMFFIPLGMMYGADVSLLSFLLSNLLPATIGNILGGAGFVGCLYWYLNARKTK